MSFFRFLLGGILAFSLPALAFSQTTTPPVDWSNNGWSYIGQKNGIAGLDANGNLTAPINTSGGLTAAGISNLGLTDNGRPIMTIGMPSAWDGQMNPHTVVIGGLSTYDVAPLKVTSPLIGPGDNGGCVLNVQDAFNEQWARCGTGNDESIVGMFKTSNQSPRTEFGADITTSPSKTTYTVEFASDHVRIRPAITAADKKYVTLYERIYSNYYSGMATSSADGKPDNPAYWYGYVGNLTDGSDTTGTYTDIMVLQDNVTWVKGWIHNSSGMTNTTSTLAPGTNDGDALDTTYNLTYTHPAVFIGTVGKRFVFNTMIQLDPNVKDSFTRYAEGEELDLQLLDTDYHLHDGHFTVHGKTISLRGYDNASDDSYLEYLAGTNLIKQGLNIDGIRYGGTDVKLGGGFVEWSQGDVGAIAVGSNIPLVQLVSQNASGRFANLLLFSNHDAARTGSQNGWDVSSLHLGLVEKITDYSAHNGLTPGCMNCAGGGQIVWNPPGHHYHLGIGQGFGGSVKYDMYFTGSGAIFNKSPEVLVGANIKFDQSAGMTWVTNESDGNNKQLTMSYNLSSPKITGYATEGRFEFTNGKYGNNWWFNGSLWATRSLGLWQSSTDNSVATVASYWMYIKLDDNTNEDIVVKTDTGNGGLVLPVMTYATLGTPSNNLTQRVCSDCYSKLHENGDDTKGIVVYYHTSDKTWRDALGLLAQH